jgi:acyl-coenzyme A synthetase/AMP-(fatty) acid ligase
LSGQPRPVSLRDALRRVGALAGRNLSSAGREVTFEDLLRRTCLGGALAGLAGRNVLVATSDQFTAALAMIELDGIAARLLICPPDLDPAHLPPLIQGAEIEAVVTDYADPLPGTGGLQIIHCTSPLVESEAVSAPARETEWLLLTSGTTGVPKMVQHSFAGLTAAIKPSAGAERAPVWATFYDIRRYGGLQIFLRGVLGTGSLLLSSAGEPVADFLARAGRAGVTHISGTPSHWRRALISPAIGRLAPDYVRLSGEIADQAVLDSLRATFPNAGIGHAYASTEAGVAFEVNDGREGFPADYVRRSGAEVEMKVEDGSLWIRSARTASRYVGPADHPLASDDGFIDTGDLVEERGGRFYFVGRRSGIINIGGLKVHPEEVEAIINRHPRVRMSLVSSQKNPITGAIAIASVVLRTEAWDGETDDVRKEILAACREALAPHKVPAVVRFVSALDVTEAGKLSRHPAAARAAVPAHA